MAINNISITHKEMEERFPSIKQCSIVEYDPENPDHQCAPLISFPYLEELRTKEKIQLARKAGLVQDRILTEKGSKLLIHVKSLSNDISTECYEIWFDRRDYEKGIYINTRVTFKYRCIQFISREEAYKIWRTT